MKDEAPGTEVNDQFKCFVGGLSYEIKSADLKAAFERYDCVGAEVMMDRNTGRPRGFGFVYFKDEHGLKDAIAAMHEKELEGRRISVVKAVPQDQTKPGTPAAALGGGNGARREYRSRDYGYRERYDRGGGGGYGGGGYGDRGGGGYGGYDPRMAYERGGYDRYAAGYGYDRGHDPYSRDAYRSGGYSYGSGYYDDRAAGSYPYPYERPAYDDRAPGGPDRRGYSAGSGRSAPYDRPADRRPSEAPPRR